MAHQNQSEMHLGSLNGKDRSGTVGGSLDFSTEERFPSLDSIVCSFLCLTISYGHHHCSPPPSSRLGTSTARVWRGPTPTVVTIANHRVQFRVCKAADSLDLTRCLSILSWISAC